MRGDVRFHTAIRANQMSLGMATGQSIRKGSDFGHHSGSQPCLKFGAGAVVHLALAVVHNLHRQRAPQRFPQHLHRIYIQMSEQKDSHDPRRCVKWQHAELSKMGSTAVIFRGGGHGGGVTLMVA